MCCARTQLLYTQKLLYFFDILSKFPAEFPASKKVGPSFTIRTALILNEILSSRCWKHSWENLVCIDMRASHSCCRFVGCISMMGISRSTTSQRFSIGLRTPLEFRELVVMFQELCDRSVFPVLFWLSSDHFLSRSPRVWLHAPPYCVAPVSCLPSPLVFSLCAPSFQQRLVFVLWNFPSSVALTFL